MPVRHLYCIFMWWVECEKYQYSKSTNRRRAGRRAGRRVDSKTIFAHAMLEEVVVGRRW